jgi:phenylacetate-CoA ligase
LNSAQPTMLSSYASMLPVLVEEAHAGRLRISPSVIWSASEVLLPEARAIAEATWQVPVVNAWMASEGPGAIACRVARDFTSPKT